MFYTIFSYLIYLFLALAATIALGYVATSRFALLSRVLVAILGRGLRIIAIEGSEDREGYSLERQEGDISVSNVLFQERILQRFGLSGTSVTSGKVGRVDISLPSFSSPLKIRIERVRVSLRQLQLPPAVPKLERDREDRKHAELDKHRRLQIIEELLWGPRLCGLKPFGILLTSQEWISRRVGSRIWDTIFKVVVQNVHINIQDVIIRYSQRGKPGPRPSLSHHLEGADEAQLILRAVQLAPRPISDKTSADGDIKRQGVCQELPSKDSKAPKKEQRTVGGFDESSSQRSLGHHIRVSPAETRLIASGISLVLKTYPKTWSQCPSADFATVQGKAPSSQAFQFTAGTIGTQRLQQKDGPRSSKSTGARRYVPSQNGPAKRRAMSPTLDDALMADSSKGELEMINWSAEEHVIFRQWEFFISVAIAPPTFGKKLESDVETACGNESSSSRCEAKRDQDGPARNQTDVDSYMGDLPHNSTESGVFVDGQMRPSSSNDALKSVEASRSPFSEDDVSNTKREVSEQIEPEQPSMDHKNTITHKGDSNGSRKLFSSQRKPGTTSSSCFFVDVSVTLKALVPQFNAASVGILSRLIDRQMHFVRFAEHWSSRPQVDVAGNEAQWWQHAGSAILREVGIVSRKEACLQSISERRLARLAYQDLYASKHAKDALFKEPGRRWWQLKRVKPGDEITEVQLREMERNLSLEEIAHFRFGIAATHNVAIAKNYDLMLSILKKIHAIVFTRQTDMDPAVIDAVLHKDREAGVSEGVKKRFEVQLYFQCPKIGVAFDLRPSSTVLESASTPFALASLHDIEATLRPSGDLDVQIGALESGASEVVTGPPLSRLIACPSDVCSEVCKAADFFRYSTTGSVISESARTAMETCIYLSVKPRFGQGGNILAADRKEGVAAGNFGRTSNAEQVNQRTDWRPGGYDISLNAAAVGVTYNSDCVISLLSFADSCESCKTMPWVWLMPSDISHSPGNATRRQSPSVTSSSAPLVGDLVASAFASSHLPVLGSLSLPSNSIEIRCPGIAVQLPYNHKHNLDIGKRCDEEREKASDATSANRNSKDSRPGKQEQNMLNPDNISASSREHKTDPLHNKVDSDYSQPSRASNKDIDAATDELEYLFIITVQNIRVQITGEDFLEAFHGGSARRLEAEGYLDIFSYLSQDSRCKIVRAILPPRIIFDPSRREFTEEVTGAERLEEQLREIEFTSMAKVWAYPDDMGVITDSIRERKADVVLDTDLSYRHSSTGVSATEQAALARWRTFSHSVDAASGLAQAMPELIHDLSHYPPPILPFSKTGILRGDRVDRRSIAPDTPGGAAMATAVSLHGLQMWISPIHIWHLISLEKTVKEIVKYIMNSRVVDSVVQDGQRSSDNKQKSKMGLEKRSETKQQPLVNHRFVFSMDIDQVSVLCLIGTWTSKNEHADYKSKQFSRGWGIVIKRSDPAYLWAQWLAPVYSASAVRIRVALHAEASGDLDGGAIIDGVLVRDLQLPDAAKHAYMLRPLPARANRLSKWLNGARREVLGLQKVSDARDLWKKAWRKLILRRRTSLHFALDLLQDGDGPRRHLTSTLLGPQLRMHYTSVKAVGQNIIGSQPKERVLVEVGQMLAYVRIKEHASMTALASQIMHISTALSRENGDEPKPTPMAVLPSATGPTLQSSMRVDIVIVGIDVLFRVQSRDLMSLKLQQGRIVLDRKSITRRSSPRDIKLHFSASIKDIIVQDMRQPNHVQFELQASMEHSLVIAPNVGTNYCSLDVMYTSQVDMHKYAPSLIVNMENPRVLLLFRFVADIMRAVEIVTSAITWTKVAGNVPSCNEVQRDLAHETAEAKEERPKPNSSTSKVAKKEKQMEFVVQLQNFSILLPTARSSHTALMSSIEHLMLALPGSALPPNLLHEVHLPTLDEMVEESFLSSTTFRFSGFHCSSSRTPKSADTDYEKAEDAKQHVASPRKVVSDSGLEGTHNKKGDMEVVSTTNRDKTSVDPIRRTRSRASKGRRRRGIIFYEDGDDAFRESRKTAGVIRVPYPDSDINLEAQSPRAPVKDDEAHIQDNVLAVPMYAAKNVVKGTKRIVSDLIDSMDGDDDGGHVAVNPDGLQHDASTFPIPSEKGRRAGNLERHELGSAPNLHKMEDLVETSLHYGHAMRSSEDKSLIAVCVEHFKVTTALLVCNVKQPTCRRSKSQKSWDSSARLDEDLEEEDLPAASSVSSFSWPLQYLEVIPQRRFLDPVNIGIIFASSSPEPASGHGTSSLHISSTPLFATLSSPNYNALMDFIGGNLHDLSGGQSSSDTPFAQVREVRFNPAMKFGPPEGSSPVFHLTLAVPQLNVVLEAHPREWTDSEPSWEFLSASEVHLLSPFFHMAVSNVLLDLGNLEGGDMHMKICTTSVDLQDLRLGYRLHELCSGPKDASENNKGVGSDMERANVQTTAHPDPVENERSKRECDSGNGNMPTPFHGAAGGQMSHRRYTRPGSVDIPPNDEIDQDGSSWNRAEFGAEDRSATTPYDKTLDPDFIRSGTTPRYATQTQAPNTGIKLSIARRLSEKAQFMQSVSDSHAITFSSPETHGYPTPGRSDGDTMRTFLPVIDFVNLQRDTMHSSFEEGHACLRILTAPHKPSAGEGLSTLRQKISLPGSNPNIRLEVNLALLKDGTMAVETALTSALLQWPYFNDMSLINSIANIFTGPPESHLPVVDEPQARNLDLQNSRSPWMYINTLLTEVEVFVPVLDAEIAEHMVAELWENSTVAQFAKSASKGDSNEQFDVPKFLPQTKSNLQHVSDLLLAAMLLDNTDSPGSLALEERGLAIAASIVRVAHAAGGDGESVIKVDTQDLCTFVRDPRARVNCVLQPFSFSAEIENVIPQAAEAYEFERLQRAAITIQRTWRQVLAERQARQRLSGELKYMPSAALALASHYQDHSARPMRRTSQSFDDMNEQAKQWRLVDRLLMDVASPHVRSLLTNYKRVSRDRSQLLFLSQYRAVSSTNVRFKMGSLTARAAFSHVPFWQTLMDDVQRIVVKPGPVDHDPSPGSPRSPEFKEPASGNLVKDSQSFRAHSLQVAGTLESAALLLCNDRPETFGAPDVLQFTVCQASLAYDAASLLPDRPSNKAGRLQMSIYSSFLNSGTSRWEPLCDLWPMTADYVDINSTMYLSDRRTNLWLESDRMLKVTFNPASLLSFGDCLAFLNAFQDRSMVDDGLLQPTPSQIVAGLPTNRGPRSSLAGAAAAKAVPITSRSASRAPQKYLIQNQSGMRLFYWTGGQDDASTTIQSQGREEGVSRSRVYTLETGESETLKVVPVMKRLDFVQSPQINASTQRLGSVINLHFEGNWMPILDVAINVVGKYKYTMLSPADNTTVPVLVDIILVGRTKIITMHSGIWVENGIDRPITLRLHIPITSLVPPSGTTSLLDGKASAYSRTKSRYPRSTVRIHTRDGDIIIGPIEPGCGCYLPLMAALDGLLFIQPDGFLEASRDVIRLSSDVNEILSQQGYVSCEPTVMTGFDDEGNAVSNNPLHIAVEANPSGVQSEFQAFKHMECISGSIQRATSPIEVYLSIQPTIIIANALPYEMRVLLWQVPVSDAGAWTHDTATPSTEEENSNLERPPMQSPGRNIAFLDILTPRSSSGNSTGPFGKRSSKGTYLALSIPPGSEEKAHVDMRQNVYLHVSVEEINMRSLKWSLGNWAQRTPGRSEQADGFSSVKLPRQLQLRILSVGMSLPLDESLVEEYLSRLKESGAHVNAAHKQFTRDTRTAMTPADIQSAFLKVRRFARKISRGSSKAMRSFVAKRTRSGEKARIKSSGGEAVTTQIARVSDGGVQKTKRPANQPGSYPHVVSESTAIPPTSAEIDTKPSSSSPASTTVSPDRKLLSETAQTSDDPSSSPLRTMRDFDDVKQEEEGPSEPQASSQQATSGRDVMRPPPLKIYESSADPPEDISASRDGMTSADRGLRSRDIEGYSRAVSDVDDVEESEVRAPYVLHMGMHNTLEHHMLSQAGVCRLSLFVPYWINNRTGVDLFLKDKASAPIHPLLLGASLPGTFGEVFAPGTSMTEALPDDDASEITGPSHRLRNGNNSVGDDSEIESVIDQANVDDNPMNHAILEYKLVLMNKQDELSLGLSHVRRRRYSQPVNIKTVGNKGSVEIKGPGFEYHPEDAASPTDRDEEDEHLSTRLSHQPLKTTRHHHPETPGHFADLLGVQPGTMLVRISTTGKGVESRQGRAIGSISRRPSSSGASVTTVQSFEGPMDSEGDPKSDKKSALQAMKRLSIGDSDALSHDESFLGSDRLPRIVESPSITQSDDAVSRKQEAELSFSDNVVSSKSEGKTVIPHESGSSIVKKEKTKDDGRGAETAQGPSNQPRRIQRMTSTRTHQKFLVPIEGHGEEEWNKAVEEALKVANRSGRLSPVSKGERVFEFAVDVTAGPPNSIYRYTKLVTLKPKYIVENQTGIPIDIRQSNVTYPEDDRLLSNSSEACRFSRVLSPGRRAAVYWDDAEMPRELVVRPRAEEDGDEGWHWSGSFPIPDTEWYFGLRIRHRTERKFMNIPVNVTVGASGSVQVTLKSPASVPPYRIENFCKDVQLFFVQVPLVFRRNGDIYVDSLNPDESMPYAWDEPTMLPRLRVQARVGARAAESRVADYSLDHLGDAPMMMLPTHKDTSKKGDESLYNRFAAEFPDELKKKLVNLLAAEFSKKVFVTVYADGPTRVLRFSDERTVSSLEHQHIILDLAARLKQIEEQLRSVNARFSRLSGVSGAHAYGLDLYGRMPPAKHASPHSKSGNKLQRRSSRKLPLPESTQALVHQASIQATRQAPVRHAKGSSWSEVPPIASIEESGEQIMEDKPSSSILTQTLSESRPSVRFNIAGHSQEDVQARKSKSSRSFDRKAYGVLDVPEMSSSQDARKIDKAPPRRPAADAALDVAAETSNNFGINEHEFRTFEDTDAPRSDVADDIIMKNDALDSEGGNGDQELRLSNLPRVRSVTSTETEESSLAAGASRHFELFRMMASSDSVLLIGGDLNLTVCQAQDLFGPPGSTHPFARVKIAEPYPTATAPEEERAKQTSVMWQSVNPVWDEQLVFRDVCAASELVVEVWDLGGTKSTTQLNALASNPTEVIRSCRFLGCAEVPLSETLESASSNTPMWCPLMRRTAADSVSGRLQLRFSWDVTTRGLLAIKLAALERVLAQRQEILAALQPIPASVSMTWMHANPEMRSLAEEIKASAVAEVELESGVPTSPSKSTPSSGSISGSLFNLFSAGKGPYGSRLLLHPSRIGAEVLARHAEEAGQRHLVVTVLEARGLSPRRGVVVALSANELPNPVVTIGVPGFPEYSTPPCPHTLNPRWAADARHIFRRADPTDTEITVSLSDARGGLLHRMVPIAKGKIHASNIPMDKPVYAWVPLYSFHRKAMEALEVMGGSTKAPDLQVFLRLQWETEIPRGSSIKIDIDAAGAGLMVVGGLQDELFNLTLDHLKACALRTHLELTFSGSIHKIQLDNQMLNAVEPVVLAPDVSAKVHGASQEGPMVTFGFIRSFAGSSKRQVALDEDMAKAERAAAHEIADELDNAAGQNESSYVDIAVLEANAADVRSGSKGDSRGIRSFKNVYLSVKPLDLMTDEAFLEALLTFMNSLPTADIWQDRAWQNQQHRLLNAQFGPKEVESLAINAVVRIPAIPARMGTASVDEFSSYDTSGGGASSSLSPALVWVIEKEAKDLDALHGQSDLSSWFFIESAEISAIDVNVTVSLTSRLISAASEGFGHPEQPTSDVLSIGPSDTFGRTLRASGFQLVNVSNVPISLGKWMVGNDPSIRGKFSNGFLSQRALTSNLIRHYTREGFKEAHKVLGGAGPAVAAVPLTVLWASGSVVVLLREVATGSRGPIATMQQVVFVPFMAFSMFVSGLSRMFAAAMVFAPPSRTGGDDATVRRVIRRPNNSLEALAGAPRELVWGCRNAVYGLIFDPVAGWHWASAPGLVVGVAKGVVGVPIRPLIGALELGSNTLAAIALAALGRDGIVGKMQRRMRPPGAFADEGTEAIMEDIHRREAEVHAQALQAAWQKVIPEFFPQMANDNVTDVIHVRSTRVILVTDRHIAYLRARHLGNHSVYKSKWLIPISEIQNIRGDTETWKISLTHVRKYDLKVFGVWPVQKRKGLRCSGRSSYERTIARLSQVQQSVQSGGGFDDALGSGVTYVPPSMEDLTILSRPYVPLPPLLPPLAQS